VKILFFLNGKKFSQNLRKGNRKKIANFCDFVEAAKLTAIQTHQIKV
jgi:hypothetical protein